MMVALQCAPPIKKNRKKEPTAFGEEHAHVGFSKASVCLY